MKKGLSTFIVLLAIVALALVAGASKASAANPTFQVYTATYTEGDLGGTYKCIGTRIVTDTSVKDDELCTLSDDSQFAPGTYVGVPQVLGPVWGASEGQYAAVYTVASYPKYAPGTIKGGVDVSGQTVPWTWNSDFDGQLATSLKLTVVGLGGKHALLHIQATYGENPPPPVAQVNRDGFCNSAGVFENLDFGSYAARAAAEGLTPAPFVQGTGLTCDVPAGAVQDGYVTGDGSFDTAAPQFNDHPFFN